MRQDSSTITWGSVVLSSFTNEDCGNSDTRLLAMLPNQAKPVEFSGRTKSWPLVTYLRHQTEEEVQHTL